LIASIRASSKCGQVTTRKFHTPATRVEGTTDAVLRRIANADGEAQWLDRAPIAQLEATVRST